MPELGQPSRRQAASPFGLASFDRDSGQHRGGRAHSRQLLYMAALIAVMRKLVGLLDTLLRENRLWQPEPPARPLQAAA